MLKSFINAISSLGSKESKVNPLSFEDARSRLTEAERIRFSEAFKRVATTNSYLSKTAFCREVLGELFPSKISECIFDACGGSSKGIVYKDVVTGLVLLTKGSVDEKIRFIFALYSADGSSIVKDDFIRFTTDVESIVIPDALLTKLFAYSNSIESEHFARWIKSNPNATSFSAWLLGDDFVLTPSGYKHKSFKLTDDHDTPTFYQTLAGVTHLEEEGIIELEKRYWKLHENSRNGKMDIHTLSTLISPPLPESIVQGFIDAFDENRDGHIDFKEMACGVSAAARGPLIERQKFCFKVFDHDKDGLLSVDEVRRMVNVMKLVMQDNLSDSPNEDVIMILTRDDEQIVEEIFMSAVSGEGMTLEEYLVWSLSNRLPEQFLALVYQICQIILGLKPLDPLEEYECVTNWLAREEKRGLKHGQIWYLISMDWWTSWYNYACPHNSVMSNSDSGMVSISGSIASQSNSIANMSDTTSNTGNGNKNESSGKSSSSSARCWATKKSTVENAVAMDVSQNVVVTAISSYDMDYDNSGTPTPTPTPSLFSPNGKSSSSSLSLVTLDSSSLPYSSSPSPVNSPSCARKQLNGSLNGYGRGLVQSKRRRPDAIDNSSLLAPSVTGAIRVPSLTSEGGRLKRDLVTDRDFKAVPQVLWNALYQWYGAGIPLARQVIQNEKKLELELYPLTLLLYRHQTITNAAGKPANTNSAPWAGMAGMYGANALSTTISYVQNHNLSPPKRVLAFTASFSRLTLLRVTWLFICQKLRLSMQDLRLDLLTNDDLSFAVVLEEEDQTLEELGVRDLSNVLMEIKNKDQTWPEEIGSLASNSEQMRMKRAASVSVEKGLTGLNNLGNTCFMNSAIQCTSNARPLTHYFSKKMHMYELNRANPLGMKGHIAKRYGDLITDIWSGTAKTIAPFKLRWTIGKYAPRFSGFQQNDAQELLAFLLDGLHEDLNRVAEKPYVELKDSDNRPDVICAQEAWENHLLRNKSIIVDLFHGQLKSSVRCKECSHESVRFDPFNFLTLPLPMESYVFCDVVVVPANGTVPIRYGLLMSIDEYIYDVKYRLAELTSADGSAHIPYDKLLIVQINNHRIQHIFRDDEKVKSGASAIRPLYAFEVCTADGNVRSNGDTVADQQIRKIMTSSKNQNAQSPLLKSQHVVENGGMVIHGHSRQNSYSSTISTGPTSITELPSTTLNWNVIPVVHRKMMRQESYFVAPQKSRPLLFGLPILVPFTEGMTHLDLYKRVWDLVGRLVTPLPPAEGPNIYNHAMDCDDSLGYEYPFVLSIVNKDAEWACGRCAWHAFCRGCPLMCSEDGRLERNGLQNCAVAIDWDPTALHLRYQTTQEFETIEHASVAQALRRQAESVSLNSCLDTFTKEEELGEDEKYYCAKCGNHQLASKKLQIWRLPPLLIVHLKRFQSMNNRWIKSHKVVEFPFHDFDPTKYLADVPRKTIELAQKRGPSSSAAGGDAGDSSLFPLQDFHQHRLLPDSDGFNLNYRLFAIICHSGIMGGGHYIAYARNPEGKWHCFNDSSCKEVQEDQIETHSAYILFYERNGLDCDSFMPRIDPRTTPVITDDELEAEENDLKKLCVIS